MCERERGEQLRKEREGGEKAVMTREIQIEQLIDRKRKVGYRKRWTKRNTGVREGKKRQINRDCGWERGSFRDREKELEIE